MKYQKIIVMIKKKIYNINIIIKDFYNKKKYSLIKELK